MKTVDEKARELTPLNEIAARKLKELREVDEYKGSNDSKDAITVMKEAMLEYANQQPETEPMFKTSKDITEHEKWKQPKQGEVDALQYNEMVQFLRKWKVDSNAIADLRGLITSTLTKTVEERALELYPVRMVEREIPKHVGQPFVYEEDDNEAARKAYIKGATDNQNK